VVGVVGVVFFTGSYGLTWCYWPLLGVVGVAGVVFFMGSYGVTWRYLVLLGVTWHGWRCWCGIFHGVI